MSRKIRKPRPQPPKWAWYDLDGCWFCKNKNNCSNCKIMKSYVVKQRKKLERKEKKKMYSY